MYIHCIYRLIWQVKHVARCDLKFRFVIETVSAASGDDINEGILIGLNGLVVKSHGNSDAVGTASAVKFAIDIASNNLLEKIKNQIDGEISLDGYLS